MFIISGIYVCAVAANKYSIADGFLQDGDYEMANQEYLKILESKGAVSLSKDIRGLTGVFISYYNLQEYKKSLSFCKKVLKLKSYNGCAIFYAGKNLEALGNLEKAKKINRYYAVLSNSDPYRPFIKSRFDFLSKRKMVRRITEALQTEGRTGNQEFPENTLAILHFVNDSDDETWDTFGKGFCQLMINDLSHIKKLKLIDRIELQVLLDELKFDQNQLMDENLVPRLGRLLKVKNIVSGAFSVEYNSKITIDIATVDLNTPDIIEQTTYAGTLENVFKLEKKILKAILAGVDIPVSGAEKGSINKIQTNNIDAFLAYCDGIDAFDLKNYNEAFNHFSLSVKLDPRFYQAKEMQQTVDAMIIINKGNLALRHFQLIDNKSNGSSEGIVTSVSVLSARLQNISNNLDLSYLPGNDSRGGAGGFNLSNIQLNRVKLPKPPDPPSN